SAATEKFRDVLNPSAQSHAGRDAEVDGERLQAGPERPVAGDSEHGRGNLLGHTRQRVQEIHLILLASQVADVTDLEPETLSSRRTVLRRRDAVDDDAEAAAGRDPLVAQKRGR